MREALPQWNDYEFNAGVMVRGALWLLQEIGIGNIFTKKQIREAFPDKAQADRRIRDLRDYGWVILSSVEDITLSASEQRFVEAGVEVWDPHARRSADVKKPVSAKERKEAFARDGHMCTICGIAGAEPFPGEAWRTAVLSVSRRTAVDKDGQEVEFLVTVCNQCKSLSPAEDLNVQNIVTIAHNLNAGELRRLTHWLDRGRKGQTELDRAWASFAKLPLALREEAISAVKVLGQGTH